MKKKKRLSNINNVFYSVYHCELYVWSENKLFVLVFVFVKHSQNPQDWLKAEGPLVPGNLASQLKRL
jgi:hypothetical protein